MSAKCDATLLRPAGHAQTVERTRMSVSPSRQRSGMLQLLDRGRSVMEPRSDPTNSAHDSGRRRKHLLPSISSVEGRVLSEPETIFYGSESQSSIIGDHRNDSGRRGMACFSCLFTFCQPSANAKPVSNDVHLDMSDIDTRSFDARYKLPGYVRPTPTSVAQDDIDHLARKNVFALPSESFRNSCITSYIHWVHFFLPLLDLRDFLAILAHPEGSCGQVSLLLLYAVMLGGATFAPQSEITKAGYTSRFAAQLAETFSKGAR